MTADSWFDPPDGVAPQIGDTMQTLMGVMTVAAILDQRDGRYLVRLTGDDPQPLFL